MCVCVLEYNRKCLHLSICGVFLFAEGFASYVMCACVRVFGQNKNMFARIDLCVCVLERAGQCLHLFNYVVCVC